MTTDLVDTRMEMFSAYLYKTRMDHKSYQYDGVRWCLHNELRKDPTCNVRGGFVADEMGLGKTIMMIGLMYCNFVPRTLIVVPPILIDQWYLQIYKTTGHKAFIYHGNAKKTTTLTRLMQAHIVITTYGAVTLTREQLKNKEQTLLHKVSWNRLIMDEAHHMRNPRTTRYLSAQLLSANIRWLVSGTPIQNSKKDFYSLCALIGLPASFYSATEQLKLLARSFILKRTKKQVGIVISDLRDDKVIVDWQSEQEMSLSEELHSALAFSRVNPEKGVNKSIVNTFRVGGTLNLMLRAKQSCIYPKLMTTQLDKFIRRGILTDYAGYREVFNHSSKLDAVTHAIIARKDNGCGKLVFCQFREELDEMARRLRAGGIASVATFDGRTSHKKRRDILGERNDVLILQIQTGCEGLNLQEHYSEIYFVSPHWNPSVEDQAIARCHRIGQTKSVYVQRFEMSSFATDLYSDSTTTTTIEKYVNGIQDTKRNACNAFTIYTTPPIEKDRTVSCFV